MKPSIARSCAAAALATALVASARQASAQAQPSGVSLETFHPAPPGDDFFGVQSPWVGGHLIPRAHVLFDYAHQPLQLVDGSGNELDIVTSQGFLHLGASLALWDRLLVYADLPAAILQSGEDPSSNGVTLASPDAASLGDLLLGVRGRIVGDYRGPFQLGVGVDVWVPTGPQDSYSGEGAVRVGPKLLLGGRATPYFVWSAASGPIIRAGGNPSGFDYGAGAAVVLGDDLFQIGPELIGSTAFETATFLTAPNGATFKPGSATNLEVLFGAKLRLVERLVIGAAAGPGLTNAVGTPVFRAVGYVGWTPRPEKPVEDADGDGILDNVDACPTTKGIPNEDPKKHGCPPPPDGDGDGIPDAQDACPEMPGIKHDDPKKNGCPSDRDDDGIVDSADACPDVKGVPSDDPKARGCPPDGDKDGIYDADDACPTEPGVADPDPKQNGCPDDRDGDGIKNKEDACPNEKGKPDPDPKQNGCPKQVRVTETEIVILQQVQFDTGKATIRPVSNALLDEVAEVMKEHPEILKVEVQGHTDNVGMAAWNLSLSQARAASVVKALVDRGIEAGRLTPKGYGQTVPIADNKTAAGKQQNRRVQFVVLEKKTQ